MYSYIYIYNAGLHECDIYTQFESSHTHLLQLTSVVAIPEISSVLVSIFPFLRYK